MTKEERRGKSSFPDPELELDLDRGSGRTWKAVEVLAAVAAVAVVA